MRSSSETTVANPTSSTQSAVAASKSLRNTQLRISKESVFVRSSRLPPSIIVMPTSPEARSRPKRSPARIAFLESGKRHRHGRFLRVPSGVRRQTQPESDVPSREAPRHRSNDWFNESQVCFDPKEHHRTSSVRFPASSKHHQRAILRTRLRCLLRFGNRPCLVNVLFTFYKILLF